MFCIYGPNGQAIDGTSSGSRREARKKFAHDSETNWGYLWDLGYRCRRCRLPHVDRTLYDDMLEMQKILDNKPIPTEGRMIKGGK